MKRNNQHSTKRKVKRTSREIKRKSPLKFIVIGLLVLLIVGLITTYYFRPELFEGFFPNPEQQEPGERPVEPEEPGERPQNSDGFFYYTDYMMGPGEFYYSVQGLYGVELLVALRELMWSTFNPVTYNDVRFILEVSDRYYGWEYQNVRGIYDQLKIANQWIGSGEGAWQREHVWPNSKLGVPRVGQTQRNIASDLHNLRAIGRINQTRSNRFFANPITPMTQAGIITDFPDVTAANRPWYASTMDNGDVARIMFYMVVMYDTLQLTNNIDDLISNSATNYRPEGAFGGLKSDLLEWHRLDPVCRFEIERNEYIYSHSGPQGPAARQPNGNLITPQGNRNPFIDRPDFVHLIFEGMTIECITQSIEVVSEDKKIILEVILVLPKRQIILR